MMFELRLVACHCALSVDFASLAAGNVTPGAHWRSVDEAGLGNWERRVASTQRTDAREQRCHLHSALRTLNTAFCSSLQASWLSSTCN